MKLSVQIEFDKILDLETNKKAVIVGRSPGCDLVIPHDAISRQHCKIEKEQGKFYITDLGSSNGVSIDDQKITPNKRVPFLPGVSHIKFGSMDCDISDVKAREEGTVEKIVSATTSGDFTSTVRLARLDINREMRQLPGRVGAKEMPLELDKKGAPKAKRPLNPVSGTPIDPVEKKSRLPSLKFTILMLILAAALWYGYGVLMEG